MRRSNFITVLVSLMCLGTFPSATYSQSVPWSSVDNIAQNYIKKNKNSGLVIGILRDGQMSFHGYGSRSKGDDQAPDRHSLFEIGGLTTVFTTTATLMVGKDHDFNMDDRVSLYFDEPIPVFQPRICAEVTLPNRERIFSCRPDPLAKEVAVSFCDLASHTSGLTCSCQDGYSWNPFIKVEFKEDEFFDHTKESFYISLHEFELRSEPGLSFRYSNVGIALLGHLVSDIAGISYAELIDQYVSTPLGLSNTVTLPRPDQGSCDLTGHNAKGRPVGPWTFDAMLPAAGLNSTAEDLLHFLEMNISSGDPGIDAVLERVRQARVDVDFVGWERPTQAGYGWLISTLNEETNLPVTWINGGTGGFRSWMGLVKDTKTAVVILSNRAQAVDEMAWKVMELLHPVRP